MSNRIGTRLPQSHVSQSEYSIFSRNRCTNCGAQAPWAEKNGCGLR